MVSMPMTTYEEFSSYKDKFYKLLDEIRNCYDTKLFDNNVDTIITPPVTIGYCTDAGKCANAINNNKFATLFNAPLPAILNIEREVIFTRRSLRQSQNIPANPAASKLLQIE